MKNLKFGKYVHACRLKGNRKPMMGPGQNLASPGEVVYLLHTIFALYTAVSTGKHHKKGLQLTKQVRPCDTHHFGAYGAFTRDVYRNVVGSPSDQFRKGFARI